MLNVVNLTSARVPGRFSLTVTQSLGVTFLSYLPYCFSVTKTLQPRVQAFCPTKKKSALSLKWWIHNKEELLITTAVFDS